MVSEYADDEVDAIIKHYISRHGSTTGERFISGVFQSKGITIQRTRIEKV